MTTDRGAGARPELDRPQRVRIGGLGIDRVTFNEAINAVDGLVTARQGGSVFTPNVDHIVLYNEDPVFRRAYEEASLSVVDGTPVLWASRLLGRALPEKISGSDLMMPLLHRAAQRGWRVFLLGGGDGVADLAKKKIEHDVAGVQIVGTLCPRIELDKPTEVSTLERIRGTAPDLIFVALGAPKQERWISEVREALRPAILVGVGGTFDFIAGLQKRAPAWVAKAGLEWAFRLLRQPGRLWKRYLVRDPRFAMILLNDMRARRD